MELDPVCLPVTCHMRLSPSTGVNYYRDEFIDFLQCHGVGSNGSMATHSDPAEGYVCVLRVCKFAVTDRLVDRLVSI